MASEKLLNIEMLKTPISISFPLSRWDEIEIAIQPMYLNTRFSTFAAGELSNVFLTLLYRLKQIYPSRKLYERAMKIDASKPIAIEMSLAGSSDLLILLGGNNKDEFYPKNIAASLSRAREEIIERILERFPEYENHLKIIESYQP